MADRPRTKAAKDIKAGDWCVFGPLSWQAGEPFTLDQGEVVIPWGNGAVSEFDPDERITIHQDN